MRTPRLLRKPLLLLLLTRRSIFTCARGRTEHRKIWCDEPSHGLRSLTVMRFSHQDSPSTDGQERHHCRLGPCVSEVSSVASRELAPRSRARSRPRLAEALTSGAGCPLQLGAGSW